MCGICGIVTFSGTPVNGDALKIMTRKLAHRGPDGEEFWIHQDGGVGFGHRRLAIIDLSDGGRQPKHYMDGTYTIIYNGEIYNYIELRNDLQKQGLEFKTGSDTEVILAAYHQYKEKCVTYLEGMFAFAIWDETKQHLFCARDRFGEKPFFYYRDNGKFIFASEIKALWAAGVQKKVNETRLFNFIALKHLFEPYNRSATFYDHVEKLEAGHYMTVKKDGAIKKTLYWDIDASSVDSRISFDDACEKFKSLLINSVAKCLRADVAVGSSLSGGLDSSLIVCLIDEITRGKSFEQKTFSARFKNFNYDEGYYMQQVVKQTRVKPHYTYPDAETFFNAFDKMVYHIEEPFATASVTAQYAVMELAKENNITVLLDGQGADEILAGYTYMFYHFMMEQARHNRSNYLKEMKAYEELYGTGFKRGRLFWMYAVFPGAYNKSVKLKHDESLAKNTFIEKNYLNEFSNHKFEFNQGVVNNLNKNLYYSISSGQLEDLLRYADRNSMAHSREIRLPFLNHHLVEFLFTLPAHFKIQSGYTKYIMRKSFEYLLPAEICWRKDKIGYETPYLEWMKDKKVIDRMQDDLKLMENKKIINKNLTDAIHHPSGNGAISGNDIFRCWVASQFLK